ncbi:MAG: PEBP family protein [Pseudomonadota bacterium]
MTGLSKAVVLAAAASSLLSTGCDSRPANNSTVLNERVIDGQGARQVTAEIWVDNWFSLAVNGKPLLEDSVPFKTERSFNAERVTFRADLPMTLAFAFRDFIENDTGLEYIGSGRQQIGDGGAIAQFTDADTGAVLKGTDATWRCLVVHRAPLRPACAANRNPKVGEGDCAAEIVQAPAGWQAPGFDDSEWPPATVHPRADVSPKGGYDKITWSERAKLIWSEDLKRDNTVLCRAVITAG